MLKKNKLPDTLVKIPLIFFPSLQSSRARHRVQIFKSPGRVHDCTVSDIKCTPAGRGGGGEESGHLFFQRESPGGCWGNWLQTWSGEANNRFRNKKKTSVSFTHTRQRSCFQSNEREMAFIRTKMSPL